jgi:hypothetical protein
MSLASSALDVGAFLLEHGDLVEDVASALASGTPKDVIKAAVKAAQTQISDDAIREELNAADGRRRMG